MEHRSNQLTILAIETSCDETAVSILRGSLQGKAPHATFTILGNALLSQIDLHAPFGGVYPALAKREHAKNLVPLLHDSLQQTFPKDGTILVGQFSETSVTDAEREALSELLAREPELWDAMQAFLTTTPPPAVDAIAVTAGPGLEPALWVGVNFARALSMVWNIPLVAVNHMEGHICTALTRATGIEAGSTLAIPTVAYPLLTLLISGGHTELVSADAWGEYSLVGATRDDAVGEAFDKVARMLGLGYPGGPEVSRLAELARGRGNDMVTEMGAALPRPLIHDPHCNFSFSGLKTAVLYRVKDKELTQLEKEDVSRAFEDAVADVLYAKTKRALEHTNARTLALGGGVSANTHIKRLFAERMEQDFPHVHLAIPVPILTTDNALMIGMAGFFKATKSDFADPATLSANGNLRLAARQ